MQEILTSNKKVYINVLSALFVIAILLNISNASAQNDLSITNVATSTPPFNIGDTVTFTLTVTNNGLTTANNIFVIDTVPSGYAFLDATTSQGFYNQSNFPIGSVPASTWDIGSIPPGQSVIMFMRLIYLANGSHVNIATVIDPSDPNQTNNTAGAVLPTGFCELTIQKDVDTSYASIGDTVMFTVTITNNGLPIGNVFVIDNLPQGMTFVSSSTNYGYYDVNIGRWDIANPTTIPTQMPSNTSAILNIYAKATMGGFIINTATLYAPCGSGVPPSDTAGVFVAGADLSLTKEVSNAAPVLQEGVTTKIKFTIKVKNEGFIPVTGVTVLDSLSSFYNIVSSETSASQGTFSSPIWNVGTLDTGEVATLDITVEIVNSGDLSGSAANGDYNNTAQINACDQFDSDSSPGNSVATEDDQATVQVTPTGIIIPEGFSPNNDSTNDLFVIENPSSIKLKLKVFNRYGNMVFESDDYKNDWNGKSNAGSDLPDGTYFYQLTEDVENGKTYTKSLSIRR